MTKMIHETATPSRKRRFSTSVFVEIELDEHLLTDVLTDAGLQNLYPLITAERLASLLAYNLIQERSLSSIPGFTDQPENAARILAITTGETKELPRHAQAGDALQVKETPNGRKYNWQCTCGARGEEWQLSPRQSRSDYKRHLQAETKVDKQSTK